MERERLKIAICSWAAGIGGGAARMESFYYNLYDRNLFEPLFISLIERDSDPDKNYKPAIPFIQLNLKERYLDLVRILIEKEIDVVQFQGSFNPVVCEAAREANVPLLVEVLHNIEDGSLFENINLTICVSDAVRGDQKKQANYITIKNGIDLEDFSYQEKKPTKEKIVFLQVGRRSKSAVNLDTIAPVLLEQFPNLEFLICGGEQSGDSTENVKFLGVQKDIKNLYSQADYLVQLSDNEPFGLVALEAMAMGVPAILSNAGGFKEIVTHQVDGYLVDPPYELNAVQTIKNILLSRTEKSFQEMRNSAREKVEKYFDIKNVIKSYERAIVDNFQGKEFQRKALANVSEFIPPNALVGEALYDFTAGRFQDLANKIKLLSQSITLISEINCLRTAHELAIYLKINSNLYPRGIFSYLFACGNCTLPCIEECATEPEELFRRGLLDRFFDLLTSDLTTYSSNLLVFIEFCLVNNLQSVRRNFIDISIEMSKDNLPLFNELSKINQSFQRLSKL